MRHLALALGLASLVACASGGSPPPAGLAARELSDTPFFPQKRYQCGPSALATVLGSAGIAVDVDALATQVYVPARKGSLQPELIGAVRRHAMLPVELSSGFAGLLAAVADGHPVLVLQNLGFGPLDVWHYATLIGYQPDTDRVILRSGTTERRLMQRSAFLRTWRRAGQWALLVLEPGALPASIEQADYLSAVVRLEASGNLPGALAAYRAGLARWPREETLLLGKANTLYGLGEKQHALTAYRETLRDFPGNVAATNNLAQTLLELGCANAALDVIDTLVDSANEGDALGHAVAQTRAEILSSASGASTAGSCNHD